MEILESLRTDLTEAMKSRSTGEVRAIRSLISAIGNAEAVEGPDTYDPSIGGHADVPRKELTSDEVRSVISGELAEREAAAEQYRRLGQDDAAAELEEEVSVIGRYV